VCMPRIPSESRPGEKAARPLAPEQFISYESDIRIIKKGGRTFVAEVTTKISELKRTNDNVIAFPTTRTKATISGEVDKTDY
jgi:hypothetical protein